MCFMSTQAFNCTFGAICTYMFHDDVSRANSMASSSAELFQTPTQPHQPRSFKFPQQLFGKKTVVAKAFFSGQHYSMIIAS